MAGYLAELADAGLKAATIARRLVVISQAHKAADLPSPTTASLLRRTHAGIRRSIGTAQTAKAPAVVDDLKRMLAALPNTASGSAIARCCWCATQAVESSQAVESGRLHDEQEAPRRLLRSGKNASAGCRSFSRLFTPPAPPTRGEGRPLTEASLQELTDQVKARGRARLAAEQSQPE